MQLVEEGKIELDAPVRRYMSWFRVGEGPASAEITVRQLLHQTSGISTYAGLAGVTLTDTSSEALERRVRLLGRSRLDRPVGESYAYSNANYDVLGLIVQVVSGQSYEEYVKRHIFAPLSMEESFVSQDEALRYGLATGHRWWFGVPLPARLPYNRGDIPAGFIIASAEDMTHYLIAQLDGGHYGEASVLSPTGMAELHRPAAQSRPGRYYGMGWGIGEENGTPVVDHEGGTGHFESAMFLAPKQGIGVVVLINVFGMIDAFSSAAGITARRIGLGVLSLASGRRAPEKPGPGVSKVYLVVDAAVLLLTVLMILTLVRLPRWRRRLEARAARGRSGLAGRVALIVGFHFGWPVLLLFGLPARAEFPVWQVMGIFQPDLTYWLAAVALVTLLKGMIEIGLVGYIAWNTGQAPTGSLRSRYA